MTEHHAVLASGLWLRPASTLAALIGLALGAIGASAQTAYPTRPVQLIVPYGAGGVADTGMRIVADKLTGRLKQPFVVENQPGANGIVGAQTVAKATPDGYTLLVYSSGFVINPYVYKSLPYDTEKDFIPVTNLVTNGGLLFSVNANLPVKSLYPHRGLTVLTVFASLLVAYGIGWLIIAGVVIVLLVVLARSRRRRSRRP